MPVISVTTDTTALTLTVIAEFPVNQQRLWDAYADARQLELFWGPPSYPATFTRHDVAVGGRSDYFMTGPEGDTPAGYWEWEAVDAPNSFEVRDGFAHADGSPNADLPTMRVVFEFASIATGSRLTATTYFASVEQLAQLADMGMEEGTRQAMGQIDAVLADPQAFKAARTAPVAT